MPKRPIRAFEASVRARLEALGFVRRRGPFILPIDDLRFGWLGLNRGTSGGVLHIHPNVGAGHQAIADLVAAGRPELPKAPRLPMPVVFAPLYVLTDGLPSSWDFETEADVESGVTGLVSAVADVGIPFMRRFETLDDFISGMRGGFGGADDYDLPAALILAGRRDEASIELRHGLDKRVGHNSEWAQQFRRFAEFLMPGIEATPGATASMPLRSAVVTTREAISRDLSTYGETHLSAVVRHLSDDRLREIGVRAFEIATVPVSTQRTRMLLAKALALAAVEILEGRPRDLVRQRRDLRQPAESE